MCRLAGIMPGTESSLVRYRVLHLLARGKATVANEKKEARVRRKIITIGVQDTGTDSVVFSASENRRFTNTVATMLEIPLDASCHSKLHYYLVGALWLRAKIR